MKSPEKGRRRTKQALKEQLREQKVMEKRMALRSRHQRKMNRKYLSDDFTSIFTENKQLLESGESYVIQTVETVDMATMEEMMETSVEVGGQDVDYTHGIKLDAQAEGETVEVAAVEGEAVEYAVPGTEVMVAAVEAAQTQEVPTADQEQMISLADLVPVSHMTRSKSRAMSDTHSGHWQGSIQ